MTKTRLTTRALCLVIACLAGLAIIGALTVRGVTGAHGLPLPSAALAHPGATRGATANLVSTHTAAVTAAQQRRVEQYWTPHRMRTAVALDAAVDSTGTGPASAAATDTSTDGSQAVPAAADPRMGVVFFSFGAATYSCSGTLTLGGNGDVVTTAGHCVYDRTTNSYATNVLFVPAFHKSDGTPQMAYIARTLVTPTGFTDTQNPAYLSDDIGFATMTEPTPGTSLTSTLGGFPISFGAGNATQVKVYGYPAHAPFDGTSLWTCAGSSVTNVGPYHDRALGCDMTQGASGGAWLHQGKIVSVTSFSYAEVSGILWGPTLGSAADAAFEKAAGM